MSKKKKFDQSCAAFEICSSITDIWTATSMSCLRREGGRRTHSDKIKIILFKTSITQLVSKEQPLGFGILSCFCENEPNLVNMLCLDLLVLWFSACESYVFIYTVNLVMSSGMDYRKTLKWLLNKTWSFAFLNKKGSMLWI